MIPCANAARVNVLGAHFFCFLVAEEMLFLNNESGRALRAKTDSYHDRFLRSAKL